MFVEEVADPGHFGPSGSGSGKKQTQFNFFNVAKNTNKLNGNVQVLVRIRIQGKTDPQD